DLEDLAATRASALLQVGTVQELGAIPQGVLLSTAHTLPNGGPRVVVERQAEHGPATATSGVGEMLGEVSNALAVAPQFVPNVGLAVAVAILATFPKSHRRPPRGTNRSTITWAHPTRAPSCPNSRPPGACRRG